MKVHIVLSVFLGIASSYPTVKTWTLNELSEVIEKNEADPEMMPYYIEALELIMNALFTGKNEAVIHVNILTPKGNKKWTLPELETALKDPTLNEAFRTFFERSYYFIKGSPEEAGNEVEVVVPALDISTWSIEDLSVAMESPDTKPALKPYLEKAKKELVEDIDAGILKEHVTILTPVGLIAVRNGEKPILVARILSKVGLS